LALFYGLHRQKGKGSLPEHIIFSDGQS